MEEVHGCFPSTISDVGGIANRKAAATASYGRTGSINTTDLGETSYIAESAKYVSECSSTKS